MSRPLLRRRRRGFSLVETMIAMGVLAVGLTGMAALQIVGVKSAQMSKRVAGASQLAAELTEAVQRWDYNDARLTPLTTITSTTDARLVKRLDLGRGDTLASDARPQFGELAGDTNAQNADSLGADYTGLTSDLDRDGKREFARYWTVFGLDLANTGIPTGKLVVVVVRWKEQGVGFRQVTTSTFRPNPQVFLQ